MRADKLQKRLRAIHAAYEAAPRPRTDRIKRLAKISSLDAVIAFLKAQPGWQRADGEQLFRLAVALADTERGRRVSWFSPPAVGQPSPPINILRKQAQAAAHVEVLHRGGLSVKTAARKVFRALKNKPSFFTKKRQATWRTVARWRDKMRALPRKDPLRQVYDAALAS